MSFRRQPSKQFLRRLKSFGKPVAPVEKVEPKSPRFKRLAHYVFRGLEVIALLFVIPTAYVLIVDLEDRQTQRIAQAWQLVTQKASGNSGKIQALEYLNSEDCALSSRPSKLEIIVFCGFATLFVPPKLKERLTGIDLSSEWPSPGVYLTGVELPGAHLGEANLTGAILQGSNLSKSYLVRANLSKADLWYADLSETNLVGVKLSYAKLRETNLSRAYLVSAHFTGASFSDTNLSESDLSHADLSKTGILSANLSRTLLLEADLSSSYLGRVDLSDADLKDANLTGAYLNGTNLSEASLKDANLTGAYLNDVNLSGAEFTGATLKTTIPYRSPLTCESLMSRSYCLFPWPLDAQSGAVYSEGHAPTIDLSLLVHLTAVGNECTWAKGLNYFKCAMATKPYAWKRVTRMLPIQP